jgi:hypothetical protein
LQRVYKSKSLSKKQKIKIIGFWDKKDENLITIYSEDFEEVDALTISAYSKKLKQTIEKVFTCLELFNKNKVRKSFVIKNLENIKGINLSYF